MNCQTAESMVNRYIEHDLSVDELEDFLEHVENCPSCYDELETYFIVHAAMQQLDEKQEDTVLDFKELLEEGINAENGHEARDGQRHAQRFHIGSSGAFGRRYS